MEAELGGGGKLGTCGPEIGGQKVMLKSETGFRHLCESGRVPKNRAMEKTRTRKAIATV